MATTAPATPVEEKAAALDLDLLVLEPPHPPRPLPRFYISAVSATLNPTALATLQLTHLVSIGAEPGRILASQFRPGHTSLFLPDILDVEKQDLLSSLLPSLLPFLASTTPADSILVHCQAGQSRSVAAVLMYLIICQGMTLVEAHAHVARSRPGVCVNSGFLRQLLFLEDFPAGLGKASSRHTSRGSTKENGKEPPSFPLPDRRASEAANSDTGRRGRSTFSYSWAAEHRLYLLSELLRATCRLSTLDPVEVHDKIEKEHKEVGEMLTTFGHAAFLGSPEKEEEEGGREDEVGEGGWIGRCRHCRQVLCTETDAVRHAGVDIHILKKRMRACVGEIGGAAPAAESVWEYKRSFERRPVLYLLPLSHAFVKARKAEEEKEKEKEREVKRQKIEKGGVEGIEAVGGRINGNNSSRIKCPYRYVYPPSWVFSALLASGGREGGGGGGENGGLATGGKKGKKNGGGGGGGGGERGGGREGGMVGIRCPGRHCGVVVGSMQARPQEGGREGGGVCECLEALPLVVVRFLEEELVIERVEEGEGGREGGKERS